MNNIPQNTLSKTDSLLRKFEDIHNFIYANDGLSTQQTLEEFIKVLFIKVQDEKKNQHSFSIGSSEYEEIGQLGCSQAFFSRIEALFDKTKTEYPNLFDTEERIKLSHKALGFIVNKLQNISLSNSSNDAKGLAFQKFLSHTEKDGRGQFFTPEPVIDYCVSIIEPQPNETIIDPACGSGGFLYSAFTHIRKHHPNVKSSHLISNNLFGVDINKSIARIAEMKLLLEANTQTNIGNANALTDLDELRLAFHNNQVKKGFDIVLTNPPFGTAGKITDKNILATFDLGYKWTKSGNIYKKTDKLQNAQTAEILFIERCIDLLNEGGRMAIVLPNGHFENPSLEYLRFYIKKRCKLLAIVNLPQETFIPYGTGVKTSLLFLQKDTENKIQNYNVFFSKINKLGYQGNKNGSPVYQKDSAGNLIKDNNNKPILDEDFSHSVEEYRHFINDNKGAGKNSFIINFDEVSGRFDFNYYAPETQLLLSKLKLNNAKKLSELVDIVKLKSKKLSLSDTLVNYVELSDVNTPSFEIINATNQYIHELPSRASYDIYTGDIITAIAGNSIGTRKHATALVTEGYDGSICTNGFRVLRNFKVDPYYLLYFLKSEYFLKQIYRLRTGAAIPNVSDADFGDILVSIPNEQIIQLISNKVKESFELREKSKRALDNIELTLA